MSFKFKLQMNADERRVLVGEPAEPPLRCISRKVGHWKFIRD